MNKKEYLKEWRENNKERVRGYYKNNKEKYRKNLKKWRENNKEKVKQYAKTYRDRHKDKIRKWEKDWRERNKDKIKIRNHNKYIKNYIKRKSWAREFNFIFAERFTEMTKSMAYLYGVGLGDAFFGKVNKYYRYSLRTIDYEFCELVRNNLENILNKKIRIRINKPSPSAFGKNKLFCICIQNGLTLKRLFKFFDEFDCTNSKDSIKVEILRGLFDSEGCVLLPKIKEYKLIVGGFDNTNKKIIDLYVRLLDYFNIKSKIEQREYSHSYRVLVYKKELQKLYSLFGNKLTIKRKDEKMKYIFGGNQN